MVGHGPPTPEILLSFNTPTWQFAFFGGPSSNTALDTRAALDLPGGGPFLQGCVSWFEQPSKGCQYYNDPKQATSPSPQSHQPLKGKTQIPLPVCNLQPYTPKDFGDIKVGRFKTEKWSSMVELGGPWSTKWKKFTCDNIQFSLMQHISSSSSSSKVIRISSFHFML